MGKSFDGWDEEALSKKEKEKQRRKERKERIKDKRTGEESDD